MRYVALIISASVQDNARRDVAFMSVGVVAESVDFLVTVYNVARLLLRIVSQYT